MFWFLRLWSSNLFKLFILYWYIKICCIRFWRLNFVTWQKLQYCVNDIRNVQQNGNKSRDWLRCKSLYDLILHHWSHRGTTQYLIEQRWISNTLTSAAFNNDRLLLLLAAQYVAEQIFSIMVLTLYFPFFVQFWITIFYINCYVGFLIKLLPNYYLFFKY